MRPFRWSTWPRRCPTRRWSYRSAPTGAADLPFGDDGRARIVCRRYAERRAIELDPDPRPECFDPQSQDCQGCAEDIRASEIETR